MGSVSGGRIQNKYATCWWSTSENMKGNRKILVILVYHEQMDGQLGSGLKLCWRGWRKDVDVSPLEEKCILRVIYDGTQSYFDWPSQVQSEPSPRLILSLFTYSHAVSKSTAAILAQKTALKTIQIACHALFKLISFSFLFLFHSVYDIRFHLTLNLKKHSLQSGWVMSG